MACEPISLVRATVTEADLEVELSDGRRLATPLSWYPTLRNASLEEKDNFQVMPWGIHWPLLDEDLSLEGMLEGLPSTKPLVSPTEEPRHTVQPATSLITPDEVGVQNGRVDFPDLIGQYNG